MKKKKKSMGRRPLKDTGVLPLDASEIQSRFEYFLIGKLCRENQISEVLLAEMLGGVDREVSYKFHSGAYSDQLCPHCISQVLSVVLDHLKNLEEVMSSDRNHKIPC